MPRQLKDLPSGLRPYAFHGVQLSEGDEEAVGACPWCSKHKFYVNADSGLFHCKVCSEQGNPTVFLKKLWEMSRGKPLDGLAADRGLRPDTLKTWGVVQSELTGHWMVPGYSIDGKLTQLAKYVTMKKSRRLLLTPGAIPSMYGGHLYDDTKPVIYLCEGPWDAMALWQALRGVKYNGKRLVRTGNPDQSLLATSSILGAVSCSSFPKSWVCKSTGKSVFILYDNDHPKTVDGHQQGMAGILGMERVAGILDKVAPKALHYLTWGAKGSNTKLPNGCDVRDVLGGRLNTIDNGPSKPLESLAWLLGSTAPVPAAWLTGAPGSRKNEGNKPQMGVLPCHQYASLKIAWRKAFKWTDGLDHALTVMLASIASTQCVGDQLWVKIIGPAACGKSTLCEAVSTATDHILAKSTIRGFHSGFKTDGKGEEDHSLISQLYGKTLVVKDGDTLLQSPNLSQILAEGRDIYDGVSRTHYRNNTSREYTGLKMTWILCGTSSLRAIDQSELGERFLDCVIMEGIDDDLEEAILWRKVHQANRDLNLEANGRPGSHYEPALAEAMGLTGGYVNWLKSNVGDILTTIENPESSLRHCMVLARFVAFMRARPSQSQEETAERELGSRLASQLVRLAKCLALVLNQPKVNEEVMGRVTRVAMDTARGQTLDMVRQMFTEDDGCEVRAITTYTGLPITRCRELLRFLQRIGVVHCRKVKLQGITQQTKWCLTPRMRTTYESVLGGVV